MSIVVDEKNPQAREDSGFRQFTNFLREEVFKPSDGPVTVEWTRSADEEGQPFYKLKISSIADIPGDVEATFTPDDLVWPNLMKSQLLSLWDKKVLKIRTEKLLQEMHEALDEED